jgi:hypothetical protein
MPPQFFFFNFNIYRGHWGQNSQNIYVNNCFMVPKAPFSTLYAFLVGNELIFA